MVSSEDIDYLNSISTVFQRGVLRVDEANEDLLTAVGIDVKNNPNYADDADIRKRLSVSAKALGEWLNEIHEDYILDKIFDAAKE